MPQIKLSAQIPDEAKGRRLDKVLAELFPDYSRSRLQSWLKNGEILVDGTKMRGKDKVAGGEKISIQAELIVEDKWEAEAIELDIVFEDESLLVINKPVGLVVHPGAGNHNGTLLNALLHHAPALNQLARAGIVHRLDKDTSGLMVVAKTEKAYQALIQQLQERSVSREYIAVCYGEMISGRSIDTFFGRHPKQRTKMAVQPEDIGKEAITHITVLEKFKGFTKVKAKLDTGRTHQIRVHMAHIGYPLVGDQLYGGRSCLPKGTSEELRVFLRNFKRQALHAARLELIHPITKELISWETKAPGDIVNLLETLRTN